MDESEEAGSELIETGGDPSELLELEEEGFDEMAFFVEPPIDKPRMHKAANRPSARRLSSLSFSIGLLYKQFCCLKKLLRNFLFQAHTDPESVDESLSIVLPAQVIHSVNDCVNTLCWQTIQQEVQVLVVLPDNLTVSARCFYQVTVFDTKLTSIQPQKSHENRQFQAFSVFIQAVFATQMKINRPACRGK